MAAAIPSSTASQFIAPSCVPIKETACSSGAPRGREHPHHAGGGRAILATSDAVLDWQGQLGKLHLALKAFWPSKLPFPLLHIDTTWKFKEMIAFRDRRAAELGIDLIVHTNQEGATRRYRAVHARICRVYRCDENRSA